VAIQAKLDQFPKTLLASMEQTAVATTPGEAIKRIQALVDVGFQYFVCTISGNDVETLTLLAQQVIPNMVARSSLHASRQDRAWWGVEAWHCLLAQGDSYGIDASVPLVFVHLLREPLFG
jgi:hypothetical protein